MTVQRPFLARTEPRQIHFALNTGELPMTPAQTVICTVGTSLFGNLKTLKPDDPEPAARRLPRRSPPETGPGSPRACWPWSRATAPAAPRSTRSPASSATATPLPTPISSSATPIPPTAEPSAASWPNTISTGGTLSSLRARSTTSRTPIPGDSALAGCATSPRPSVASSATMARRAAPSTPPAATRPRSPSRS